MAALVGRAPCQRARRRSAAATVLQPHDVPLPVGRRPARRQHVRVHRRRHLRALQTARGFRRVRADRLRRLRHPLRELRALDRRPSGEADPAEHRDLPPPAAAFRRHVRLAPRALDHGSPLLQVDAVALPAVLQGGTGVPQAGRGQLVSGVQDRARERAGHQRLLRAAPRRAGRAAVSRAVVLRHHPVRRAAVAEPGRARLVREHRRDAAQLDRAERGRRVRLRDARRGGDHRLHDAARHRVRRHLHGARSRAPARGRAHGGRAATGRKRVPARGPDEGHRVSEGGREDEDRRVPRLLRPQPRHRRSDPRLDRRLRADGVRHRRHGAPPIPIIHCDRCGPVGVPEKDLPVELPFIEDFRPDDTGVSPLARHREWYFVKCPQCGALGRRETDVSDTFLDSAWYFLRYPSTEFDDRPWDPQRTKTWLPVTSYIGGNEHAVLHLLYSRFVTMALRELGHLHFEEPFPKLRAHGLIIKDGAKMSKSRGNVVIPDAYIQKWGADTVRMYLMFLGPFQEGGDFRDEGITGIRRFLDKVWALAHEAAAAKARPLPPAVEQKLHQTIKKVTADTESLNYNTAIAAMMEYVNEVRSADCGVRSAMEPLLVLLAPYAPHLAEELWCALGHGETIFTAPWPGYDDRIAAGGDVEIAVQVNGKLRRLINRPPRPSPDHRVQPPPPGHGL